MSFEWLESCIIISHAILDIKSITGTCMYRLPTCIFANMTFLLCLHISWTFVFLPEKHSMVAETQQGTKNIIFYRGIQDFLGSIRPWSICSCILTQAMSKFQYFRGKWNYSEKREMRNFLNEIWIVFLQTCNLTLVKWKLQRELWVWQQNLSQVLANL